MKQKHTVTVDELGITFSTGSIAKQANGAVVVSLADTNVFVSAVVANSVRPDQDFFPLTVDYREKFSAAGRFPGGFIKREGRPSEKEILTSRLCDRPLRPLFDKGFINEVQVIGILLSADMENEPDILMVNGASAALMCSDIPWNGPVGCVRVGEIDGEFVANPTNDQLFESTLDLIYVGTEKEMLMIEGSADQLPDERFIEALEFAHQKVQKIIDAQKELAKLVNKTKKEFKLIKADEKVLEICKKVADKKIAEAVFQDQRSERDAAVSAIKEEAIEAVKKELGEENFDGNQVRLAFEEIQEHVYRHNILDAGKRADGRGPKDLRTIECETDVLPRVHGSAIFARGETQALVLATLGTSRDSQDLDGLTGGAQSKSFLLHYNFPPFSVGETGRFGFTSRREIGHGALAERSLLPVLPPEEDFPYSIRLVSEVMESNGSTSMASICGGCLALMDAGVPISSPVAGISVGLVAENDNKGDISKYVLLTDILGAEDHFGDMDFKIAGTSQGITGFQLDLKIKGLPLEIAKEAIQQNKEARFQILNKMKEELPEPKQELKAHAPRVHQMQIDPDKIGLLIGPGGKNIKKITEVSGAQIDINEDNSGRISIFATSQESMDRAISEVNAITSDIEPGQSYSATVKSVREFGVFVECLPGKEGLVHVSELAEGPVDNVEDVCKLGDVMTVKCIGIDEKGRVRLSRRAAICEEQGIPYVAKERPAFTGNRERGGFDRGGDRGGPRRSGGGGFDRGGPRRSGGGGGDRDRGNRRERFDQR
ncbi:MAG: polyribonucleotide nucleotidyltransferase [Verrucomicrobia bacterium CG_4_10_14_3_um_filter_43_23]|nr:MAG: polyribonucleotide nucleotidyltransferase [Verrucomicrobia bacterium CG_4_10_14_3_um_filter_43_23]PIY61491.1 MAG: polyribonucleotide nucleotidyltransferase [Verrucomicrobia bacterium CG_4_10_14_0_8_um_filter_43_34]PJA44803.1 MAG: polyribonucleotide nucleotidyltransferase [Verrucomicrobia bacterium CG_4_9_14_3_um_filter_43_20]